METDRLNRWTQMRRRGSQRIGQRPARMYQLYRSRRGKHGLRQRNALLGGGIGGHELRSSKCKFYLCGLYHQMGLRFISANLKPNIFMSKPQGFKR